MYSSFETLDRVDMAEDKTALKYFKEDEFIILSSKIIKYNEKNKKQTRIFVLTNLGMYNLKPKSFLSKSYEKRIKRFIPLDIIYAVSVAKTGYEFTLHVPTQYDYRFSSEDFRDQIIYNLAEAFLKKTGKFLGFFMHQDFSLENWTTTKIDIKKNPKINRLPQEDLIQVHPTQFFKYNLPKDQSEIIFIKNGIKELKKLSIEDFDIVKVLGRGGYGKVMLCQLKKDPTLLFAIKTIRKMEVIENDQFERIRTERILLEKADHPFLLGLEYAFQTREKIYFVMKFISGGDMFFHLQKVKRITEQDAKFYAACIVMAIECLHKMGCAYRDLKPENIMIDEQGYLKLVDYGLAKFIAKGERSYSIVGTPEYLAPEIIKEESHSFEIDYWCIGTLIFEMVFGAPPFFNSKEKVMYKQIIEKKLEFPYQIAISDELKDLLNKLLEKEPLKRLSDSEQVKSHPWFKDINFRDMYDKKVKPPFIPQLGNLTDVLNFSKEMTNEKPRDTYLVADFKFLKKYNIYEQEFENMSFSSAQLKDE